MPRSARITPITFAEARDLRRACEQLAALKGMLMGTNWAGAPACIVMTEQVYAAIAPMYNRCEPFLPEYKKLLAKPAGAQVSAQESAPQEPARDGSAPPAPEEV